MYTAASEVEETPFSHVKCATMLCDAGRSEEAVEEIDDALAANAAGKYQMSSEAWAQTRYVLGAAYAKLGRCSESRPGEEKAVAIKPDLRELRTMLLRILDMRSWAGVR